MKIWAHTLFKNEERWLWFAVTSVIDHVDKLLLWDTGSTDRSWEIARELKSKYGNKIDLRQYGEVTPETFPEVRQAMLDATDADWFIIVDGDEIWWDDSIRDVVNTINSKGYEIDTIVNKTYNPIGDIFHLQPEHQGKYKFDHRKGHLAIRAVNLRINGLKAVGNHGVQGYYNSKNILIQDLEVNRRIHLESGYMHMTNIRRSGDDKDEKKVPKRYMKIKFDLGSEVPYQYYYPEAFFIPKPEYIYSPWVNRSSLYIIVAIFIKPLKWIKRKLNFNTRDGY